MPDKDTTITTEDIIDRINDANDKSTTVLEDAVVTGNNKSGTKPITAGATTEDKSGIIPIQKRLGVINSTLPEIKTDLSGAINSDTTSALAAGKEQLNLSPEAQSIAQAYYSPIKDLSKKTEEMVKARDAAKAQDEVAQRRGRSMKMIAGISDGLASLANLIGVGQGGTNIDLGAGSLNPLSQKLEAARLERKADIKSIDDRLEQARQQMLQMQLAKGKDVAAAEERERARKFTKEENELNREFQTSEREAAQNWKSGERTSEQNWKSGEATLDRKSAEKIAKDKIQATQAEAAAKRAHDLEKTKIQEEAKTGGKEEYILTDEDGKQTKYEMSKTTSAAILKNFNTSIQKDVKMIEQPITDRRGNPTGQTETVPDTSTPLGKAYAHYLELVEDKADSQEIKNAMNEVISLSPTMRAEIIKYSKNEGSKWDGNKVG